MRAKLLRCLVNACAIMAVCLTAMIGTTNAETFVLKSGESFEGTVIRSLGNTVTIKLTGSGMRQVPLGQILKVKFAVKGGDPVSGSLFAWSDGVYEIRRGDRLIRVREGKVLSAEKHDALPSPPKIFLTAVQGDENGGELKFTVGFSAPTQKPILLIYSTADLTAKAGVDYEEVRGALKVKLGSTNAVVRIPLVDDQIAEGNESFELLVTTDLSVANVEVQRATATILDND